jgi:hypothetical protein
VFVYVFSSSDSRPFKLGPGSNVDKVVRLDREMTKVRFDNWNVKAIFKCSKN